MVVKRVTLFMLMITGFFAVFFVGVSVLDPLLPVVQGFNLGGMGSQTNLIHAVIVKYMPPVFIATALIYAVVFILKEERQTVR